eukprot:TRINITY_DN23444_c0_g2_i2.p1 TRINITY_DN23444_c0_g2~~TRINITY_DN23444_c0_g2_i2.p1  ORF type:complete len:255 (+),score=66.46 TRINITY_DN23444_c0_g2_i2:43-765(+)
MGASCGAPQGARSPGDPWLVKVIRTGDWGLGAEDDTWSVEVPEAATVYDLKAHIEDLYDVPVQIQRLSLSREPREPALEDAAPVSELGEKRVYLLPVSPDDAMSAMLAGMQDDADAEEAYLASVTEQLMGAAQEASETRAALEESLKDVTYDVIFSRPLECGGKAPGKEVALSLDALALVGDVQQMVEIELFDAVGAEPAVLVFNGQPLRRDESLYAVGIENGSFVQVLTEQRVEAEALP